ncbi:MAG: tubulin-like doman-containing protein [Candidatus Bipolaricaulota bacterium]
MAVTVRRALLVGLGGTGTKVLQYIKGQFLLHEGRVPPQVRLLAIDTDRQVKVNAIDKAIAALDRVEFFRIDLRDIRPFIRTPEISSWVLPDEMLSFEDMEDGAGARRVSGRIAFFSEAKEIQRRIDNALVALRTAETEPDEGLAADDADPRDAAQVEVYVVGSLAGGTGSGMFLDVGYMLRDMLGPERNRIVGFFLLPKAYTRIPNSSSRVEGNGYAALKELDYLMGCKEEFTVEYPLGVRVVWGGSHSGRKPFNFIYLLDDINDRELRVKDLETLQHVSATALFLHLTIETQAVRSFWRNLIEEVAEKRSDWAGKRARYMSTGMSTLEVPIERSVDLAVLETANELLHGLAMRSLEAESTAVADGTPESEAVDYLAARKLTAAGLAEGVGKLTSQVKHEVLEGKLDSAEAYIAWMADAKGKLGREIDSWIGPNSANAARLVVEQLDALVGETERLVMQKGAGFAMRFLAELGRGLDAQAAELSLAKREEPSAEPDYKKPFLHSWTRAAYLATLSTQCKKHLDTYQECTIKAAAKDLATTVLTAVDESVRALREDMLPRFERTTGIVAALLQQERNRISTNAAREPFTVDLGTQLLKMDLGTCVSKTTMDYVVDEWAKHRVPDEELPADSKRRRSVGFDSFLSWGLLDPEYVAAWLRLAVARQFDSVLGQSVDDRLKQLWADPSTKPILKKKLEDFAMQASPLWRVTPARNAVVRQFLLFGIAERETGKPSMLRKLLGNEDEVPLPGADGHDITSPSFATTWEKYRFRALRIAVPAAAYALKHMKDYRARYLEREGDPEFSHHISKDWVGVDSLPDLFPLAEDVDRQA